MTPEPPGTDSRALTKASYNRCPSFNNRCDRTKRSIAWRIMLIALIFGSSPAAALSMIGRYGATASTIA
jgi:hypothetical protein